MDFKLGCDPELFLADVTGKLRASCGKIGGTKRDPAPLPLGDGFCVQEDNVAIEFNIPPASNAAEFVSSIHKTLAYLAEDVKKRHGFVLASMSAASFPEDELQHPAAQEFGCDPDFNAWTLRPNPRPKADDHTLRSCGGHIHVGFDPGKMDPVKLIRCMDLFLGVPSVLMDQGEKRKLLYGKRGAFRPKSYGAEYRTLSNFWVLNERLTKWAWDNTERAIQAAMSDTFVVEDFDAAILRAIDQNDKVIAADLVAANKLEVVSV